ncbi:MAG: nuclear transport factor 2 family protein [Chloroflexi bacterium]|nr:nuclear transport factor 2 family protein [Chloroflexota bacterium]
MDEQEIIEIVKEVAQGWNTQDLHLWEKNCNPEILVFEGGRVNRGWEDFRDNNLKSGWSRRVISKYHWDTDTIDIYLEGSLARAVSIGSYWFLNAEGKKFSGPYIESFLLRKQDSGWKIIQMHGSGDIKPVE